MLDLMENFNVTAQGSMVRASFSVSEARLEAAIRKTRMVE